MRKGKQVGVTITFFKSQLSHKNAKAIKIVTGIVGGIEICTHTGKKTESFIILHPVSSPVDTSLETGISYFSQICRMQFIASREYAFIAT